MATMPAIPLPSCCRMANVLVEGDSGTSYVFDGPLCRPDRKLPDVCMLLPTGQVLVGGSPTEVYTPAGTYQTSWQPAISTLSIEHNSRLNLFDLGHAVQWIVAGGGLRRRIPNGHELSAGAHHEQQHQSRFLRQNARPQHDGRGTGSAIGFDKLRRAGHNGNRRKHA